MWRNYTEPLLRRLKSSPTLRTRTKARYWDRLSLELETKKIWNSINYSRGEYLCTNTVLDVLWFCSCAIETTFPLSNFRTKHIFGIFMDLRKLFLPPPKVPQFFFLFFFTTAQGGGFHRSRHSRHSREYYQISDKIHTWEFVTEVNFLTNKLNTFTW